MTAAVPTLEQCLLAVERLPMRRIRNSLGYTAQLWQPASRGTRKTTGFWLPRYAGALLIAADGCVGDMTGALLRASVLERDWTYTQEGDPFGAVVADRALLMLRAEWRRDDFEVSRDLAEQNALSLRLVWWSE
jgi:hypothetical protein